MGEVVKGLANCIVAVRGGGDLATGIIQKLWRSGFSVVVLETAVPLAIRRTVSLCTAVTAGEAVVEDVTAIKIDSAAECEAVWRQKKIPVLVDPEAKALKELKPSVVVDAILAKRNLGTTSAMAPLVLALGPGFSAPEDADGVIETMRGHYLGRLVTEGKAIPNTGIPGTLGGKSAERVIHAPVAGTVHHCLEIGAQVKKGETLFYLDDVPVPSPLDGTLRGLIADKISIPKGLKSADVDPRPTSEVDCYTISDKARALGGAVLEAIFYLGRQKQIF